MRAIAIRYGMMMFVCLLAYFLLMQWVGLAENFQLRILNGVIHLAFITVALNRYRRDFPDEWNYLSAVATGVITSVVAIALFAIFQIVYLSLNDDFMAYLQENVNSVGQYLTPVTAALIVLVEGLAVSVIGSYIVMRILNAAADKTSDPPYK
ncbi:MAG: DUF4199 domain-containing protein [Saprospiraceae bacterium]|nr:DUF4199 domain-containing protein [Saprospiraceae bacterium]